MSQSKSLLSLDKLLVGERAQIVSMELPSEIKMKLVAYGLAPGDPLEIVGRSPLKGPISIQTAFNERVALRREHASNIQVQRDESNE